MRLSIILNMYNTAVFMPRCIDSLLRQDIPASDYEVIMVNDGSPDDSLAMAERYVADSEAARQCGEAYPLMRVCSHPNKGLAGARNTGIDAAHGEYLCFVDPDDYIQENSLSALLRRMDSDQLDMLRFNYQKVDEAYNPLPDSSIEANFDYSPEIMSGIDFLANRLTISCYVWAYIYRTSFVRESGVRFIEGCFFDDTPWLPRILQKAERVSCSNIRHQFYLQRGGSMVHSINPAGIKRKVEGQLMLVDILSEQKKAAHSSVTQWYDMMLAHTVLSLLSSLAVVDLAEAKVCCSRLRQAHVFPLSEVRLPGKSRRKVRMLNFCPNLFLTVLNLKNK